MSAADAPELHDDTGLTEAARAGDATAFGQLYARYASMVHGILLARLSLPAKP